MDESLLQYLQEDELNVLSEGARKIGEGGLAIYTINDMLVLAERLATARREVKMWREEMIR